ncbi:10244_t:CDS:2, partial [Cetraspora pellucida]
LQGVHLDPIVLSFHDSWSKIFIILLSLTRLSGYMNNPRYFDDYAGLKLNYFKHEDYKTFMFSLNTTHIVKWALIKMLLRTCRDLESLSVEGILPDTLLEIICRYTNVTNLKISYNYLSYYNLKALFENDALSSLDLSDNKFYYGWSKALSLCKNTELTDLKFGHDELDLWSNDFGSQGIRALAKALYKNTSLTTLKLGSTGIRLDDIEELAKALHKNNTLKVLDHQFNYLDFEGGNILVEGNNKSTVLNLYHNKFMSQEEKFKKAKRNIVTFKFNI